MAVRIDRVDSALGSWTVAHFFPEPGDEVAATIASAWYFEGTMTHRRERVFPKGTHGLIVQLDEPHRDRAGTPFPPVVYSGVTTRAVVVEAPSRTRVIGLEFRPAAGFSIFGRGVHETKDVDVDLSAVLGVDAQALLEACRAAVGPAEILMTAVKWCARRAARAAPCDPGVGAAVARIERARGCVRIADLAASLGRSERAFERTFRERVGLVPKRFARIARFAYAHSLLGKPNTSLSQVANGAGYYDQAHFNADFREHTGMSPTRYLTGLRYPGTTSLAEVDE